MEWQIETRQGIDLSVETDQHLFIVGNNHNHIEMIMNTLIQIGGKEGYSEYELDYFDLEGPSLILNGKRYHRKHYEFIIIERWSDIIDFLYLDKQSLLIREVNHLIHDVDLQALIEEVNNALLKIELEIETKLSQVHLPLRINTKWLELKDVLKLITYIQIIDGEREIPLRFEKKSVICRLFISLLKSELSRSTKQWLLIMKQGETLMMTDDLKIFIGNLLALGEEFSNFSIIGSFQYQLPKISPRYCGDFVYIGRETHQLPEFPYFVNSISMRWPETVHLEEEMIWEGFLHYCGNCKKDDKMLLYRVLGELLD